MKLYYDKRRTTKDGGVPVKIRLTHRGKSLMISTGLVYKKGFNEKVFDAAARALLAKAEKEVLELTMSGLLPKLSPIQLQERVAFAIGRQKKKTLSDVFDEFVTTKEREGTRTVYCATRNKIESYDPEATLDSVDVQWLRSWESAMKQEGLKINGIGLHLRNLRSVMNYARRNNKTMNYPFYNYKIATEETRKRNLTKEQLLELRDYVVEPHQEKYRDMFMLMFYLRGINAADLFQAKKEQVINGRLEYKRAKTGKLYSVFIEPEAQVLIDRYEGEECLLSFCDHRASYKSFLRKMDLELSRIGAFERKGLGGRKIFSPAFPGLSSYWSRHTWASMAYDLGVSLEVISQSLGHSFGSRVTNIYINKEQSKIDKANRLVIDALYE